MGICGAFLNNACGEDDAGERALSENSGHWGPSPNSPVTVHDY